MYPIARKHFLGLCFSLLYYRSPGFVHRRWKTCLVFHKLRSALCGCRCRRARTRNNVRFRVFYAMSKSIAGGWSVMECPWWMHLELSYVSLFGSCDGVKITIRRNTYKHLPMLWSDFCLVVASKYRKKFITSLDKYAVQHSDYVVMRFAFRQHARVKFVWQKYISVLAACLLPLLS